MIWKKLFITRRRFDPSMRLLRLASGVWHLVSGWRKNHCWIVFLSGCWCVDFCTEAIERKPLSLSLSRSFSFRLIADLSVILELRQVLQIRTLFLWPSRQEHCIMIALESGPNRRDGKRMKRICLGNHLLAWFSKALGSNAAQFFSPSE